MARPSRALIDLGALRHNYRIARSLHGGRMLAVLKADAYGHGAVRCARALEDIADGFAVAFIEEAVALRAGGVSAPILVLEGVFEAYELQMVESLRLWTVVHHEAQLRMVETRPDGSRLNVWLKVDSGMHRAGFAPADTAQAYRRLQASGRVDEITLMTHFARADEPMHDRTREQIACFEAATAGLWGRRSLSNSAGVLAWPRARADWGRAGILLYGADPLPGGANAHGLRPVMHLQGEIFAERRLAAGEPLGYGGGFVAEREMRVGLVAVGYADGYPRTAPAGTPVAVDGCLSRLVGRVSMDMLTVDLGPVASAGIGSRVELWGGVVDVNDVAALVGTIAYELLCNVKRVPLVYAGGALAGAEGRGEVAFSGLV